MPGLNVRAWREAMTGAGFAAGSLLACGMCALTLHPGTAAWFAIHTRAPAVLFAAWPLSYGVAMWMRKRVEEGRRWPVVLLLVHGAALWSTLGACSSVELGFGFCFFLLMPPCWGHLFPHNRALLVATLLAPPLQRALFTQATLRSVAVAAAVGALVALAYWTFSLRHTFKLAAERRALAREALGASTVDGTATLHVAMGLHDRLSGAVMLARARTKAGDARETLRAAESLLEHARGVLDGARFGRHPTVHALRSSLEELGRRMGVDLRLDVRGRVDATDAAIEDVGQILVELLANEARHGVGVARVTIDVRRADVRVRFRSATPIPSRGSGRGLRNIAARARARGGEATITADGALELVVPLESHWSWSSAVLLLEAAIHFGTPALAWVATRNVIATAVFAAVAIMLGMIQVKTLLHLAIDRRTESARRRSFVEEAARPTFGLAKGELTPELERLERAVARGDASDAREIVGVVSERLAAVLLAFETAARDGSDARAQLLSATNRAEAPRAQPATDP